MQNKITSAMVESEKALDKILAKIREDVCIFKDEEREMKKILQAQNKALLRAVVESLDDEKYGPKAMVAESLIWNRAITVCQQLLEAAITPDSK